MTQNIERLAYVAVCWGYVCTVGFKYYKLRSKEPEKKLERYECKR
jgi:hypothetical protein